MLWFDFAEGRQKPQTSTGLEENGSNSWWIKGAWVGAESGRLNALFEHASTSSCLLPTFSPAFWIFKIFNHCTPEFEFGTCTLDWVTSCSSTCLPGTLHFPPVLFSCRRPSSLFSFAPPSLTECSSQSQGPCVSTPLTLREPCLHLSGGVHVCVLTGALCVSVYESVIFCIVCICHCRHCVCVCVCKRFVRSCSLPSLVAVLH